MNGNLLDTNGFPAPDVQATECFEAEASESAEILAARCGAILQEADIEVRQVFAGWRGSAAEAANQRISGACADRIQRHAALMRRLFTRGKRRYG